MYGLILFYETSLSFFIILYRGTYSFSLSLSQKNMTVILEFCVFTIIPSFPFNFLGIWPYAQASCIEGLFCSLA